MKASRVEFGNPHVYVYITDNFVIKAQKSRVTRVNAKQYVLWISGKPLVFEL
jgi:hypothetical protein